MSTSGRPGDSQTSGPDKSYRTAGRFSPSHREPLLSFLERSEPDLEADEDDVPSHPPTPHTALELLSSESHLQSPTPTPFFLSPILETSPPYTPTHASLTTADSIQPFSVDTGSTVVEIKDEEYKSAEPTPHLPAPI